MLMRHINIVGMKIGTCLREEAFLLGETPLLDCFGTSGLQGD